MIQDYYEILGVAKDADATAVKKAYRDLALRYHPDRNIGDAEAAESMKRVNEAYAVLSDAKKRQEYDRLSRQHGGADAANRFRQNYSYEDIFSGTDIQHVFDELAKSFGFRGFDDIFKEFYDGSAKAYNFDGPGYSGKGFYFFGTFGTGRIHGNLKKLGAVGRLAKLLLGSSGILPKNGNDLIDTIRIHADLAKSGGPFAYYHRWQSKKLVVKIPPGVRAGQRIRLAGMGAPGKGGAAAGDLYLKISLHRPIIDRLRAILPI